MLINVLSVVCYSALKAAHPNSDKERFIARCGRAWPSFGAWLGGTGIRVQTPSKNKQVKTMISGPCWHPPLRGGDIIPEAPKSAKSVNVQLFPLAGRRKPDPHRVVKTAQYSEECTYTTTTTTTTATTTTTTQSGWCTRVSSPTPAHSQCRQLLPGGGCVGNDLDSYGWDGKRSGLSHAHYSAV